MEFLRLSLARAANKASSWSIVVGHHPPLPGSGDATEPLSSTVPPILDQGKYVHLGPSRSPSTLIQTHTSPHAEPTAPGTARTALDA